ncbi:MAG: hypothetical protein Q4B48_08280, partial [Syntrophomonadaceae bacterium]|nr:hypothetical protein [Syntrophomonadaceae bacterium]
MQMKTFGLVVLIVLILTPSWGFARSDVTLGIEPLYQTDYTDTLCTYEGEEKSVKTSGCGAVCLSMAMGYLDSTVEQTPETLFLWACDSDLYHGNGLGYSALVSIL